MACSVFLQLRRLVALTVSASGAFQFGGTVFRLFRDSSAPDWCSKQRRPADPVPGAASAFGAGLGPLLVLPFCAWAGAQGLPLGRTQQEKFERG